MSKATAQTLKRPRGRREEILAAALRLFNEHGVGPVSTNHIAADLGISPGNLYYHFRNKEDILQKLFEGFRAEVETHLGAEIAQSPEAALDHLIDGSARVMFRHRFILEERAVLSRLDARFAEAALKFHDRLEALIAQLLQGAVTLGWIPAPLSEEDRGFIARNIVMVVDGCIDFARIHGRGGPILEADVRLGLRHAFHILMPYCAAPLQDMLRQRLRT